MKKVQVTEQGLQELTKELSVLVDKKRPALVKRLARARAEGDLKENSDYQNARDELEFMDGKIDELKHVVETAVVVKAGKKGEVSVGTKVTIETGGTKAVFNIVGEWEADPMNQKISHESPIGAALIGKKAGDEVEVEAPAGKITYKILSVE